MTTLSELEISPVYKAVILAMFFALLAVGPEDAD